MNGAMFLINMKITVVSIGLFSFLLHIIFLVFCMFVCSNLNQVSINFVGIFSDSRVDRDIHELPGITLNTCYFLDRQTFFSHYFFHKKNFGSMISTCCSFWS
jgi:hypothetical protein